MYISAALPSATNVHESRASAFGHWFKGTNGAASRYLMRETLDLFFSSKFELSASVLVLVMLVLKKLVNSLHEVAVNKPPPAEKMDGKYNCL